MFRNPYGDITGVKCRTGRFKASSASFRCRGAFLIGHELDSRRKIGLDETLVELERTALRLK